MKLKILDRDVRRGLSIRRRCDLLGLPRSRAYRRPKFNSQRVEDELSLMNRLDHLYMAHPFYGVRRMTHQLRVEGHCVNPKRVRRLLRMMGIEALYPKPRLSVPGVGHKVYPYLLKGLAIDRVDQVWCCDVTYIRLHHGFCYLCAVMDWHSRYVLAWELSNTLEASFCVQTLKQALSMGTPEIFNTDQGSQFTSDAFTGVLLDAGIRISMDGRGRAFDNIFIERLWWSVKHEDVYIRDYENPAAARAGLARYFEFYNTRRLHQALGYRTPRAVHWGVGEGDAPSPSPNPTPYPQKGF
jgi:putative transposase